MKLTLFSLLTLLITTHAGSAKDVHQSVTLGGAKVEFTASELEDVKIRETTNGFCTYDGQLYQSAFSPPVSVLKSGTCEIDGRKIELDVSHLCDPWIGAQKLDKKFVKIETLVEPTGKPPVKKLTVIFTKGGGGDYMVEWIIFEGKSMRSSVAGLGDTYPGWVKEK